jgi:hypothetical protein
VVCRISLGVCDPAELCDGEGAACPADVLADSDVVCRAAGGPCDRSESCDGTSTGCAGDAFEPPGAACGSASSSDCDLPDSCDAAGSCAVNFEADGTDCANENICALDVCALGVCELEPVPGCPVPVEAGHGGAELGRAVAMTAELLVAGAPAPEKGAGRVHVFERAAGVWVEQPSSPLAHPELPESDFDFGAAVDVDGDTIVVGAPFDAAESDPPTLGSVTVFVREDAAWNVDARLVDESGACAGLGASVAIRGDTIAAGAPAADCALVFERSGNSWSRAFELRSESAAARLGASVDVAGDSVAVGAPGVGAEDGCDSAGAVTILRRTNVGWRVDGELEDPEGEGSAACFGAAVALERSAGVIGAPFDGDTGTAWLVERGADGWQLSGRLPAGAAAAFGDRFGSAVALSGNVVVAGAPGVAASLFERSTVASRSVESWSFVRRYVSPVSAALGEFGASVAVAPALASADASALLAVGAPGESAGDELRAGAIYPAGFAPASPELCGDADTTASEGCDDGDTSWTTGEACTGDCLRIACGDVNDSGTLTASDALFALRAAVGAVACAPEACDATGDSSVTASDALSILRAAVGADVELDCR